MRSSGNVGYRVGKWVILVASRSRVINYVVTANLVCSNCVEAPFVEGTERSGTAIGWVEHGC
jgi:hypothetical protein